MTTTAKSGGSRHQAKSWLSQRRNRNKVWLGLLGVGLVTVIAILISLRSGGDGGASITTSAQPSIYRFETSDTHALAFVPGADGDLLFGHHGGLMRSDDAGRSWRSEPASFDAMNIVFGPSSSDTVFVAGHDVLTKSADAGATWSPVANNLPGLDLHAFGASAQAGRYYAHAAGHGLYVSTDGAASWALLSDAVPQGTHSIVELPDGTLLLGAADQGILRSADGGKTWVPSRDGIDNGVIFTLKAGAEGSRLYAGTSVGLFVSGDDGRSWDETALNDTMIMSVGVKPSDALDVMAVGRDGSLYRSTDGGATWLE